jgi:hypothetical protein
MPLPITPAPITPIEVVNACPPPDPRLGDFAAPAAPDAAKASSSASSTSRRLRDGSGDAPRQVVQRASTWLPVPHRADDHISPSIASARASATGRRAMA